MIFAGAISAPICRKQADLIIYLKFQYMREALVMEEETGAKIFHSELLNYASQGIASLICISGGRLGRITAEEILTLLISENMDSREIRVIEAELTDALKTGSHPIWRLVDDMMKGGRSASANGNEFAGVANSNEVISQDAQVKKGGATLTLWLIAIGIGLPLVSGLLSYFTRG